MVSAPQNTAQRRSLARTAVVWDSVKALLDAGTGDAGTTPRTVLDIGGGTGGFAVRVAELGHRVTVVDPSPDALATLGRRADESGVADRVTAVQGDLAGLADLVAPGSVDLVLCHGVLEIVDPAPALATIAATLRPGGSLSLLVNQRHAAVLARAMAGHFVQALALLDETPGPAGQQGGQGAGHGGHRYTADEIVTLLDDAGFAPPTLQAVRVFADLVPSTLVDLEPGSVGALVELERAVAQRPEYLPLATQIHALAIRG